MLNFSIWLNEWMNREANESKRVGGRGCECLCKIDTFSKRIADFSSVSLLMHQYRSYVCSMREWATDGKVYKVDGTAREQCNDDGMNESEYVCVCVCVNDQWQDLSFSNCTKIGSSFLFGYWIVVSIALYNTAFLFRSSTFHPIEREILLTTELKLEIFFQHLFR